MNAEMLMFLGQAAKALDEVREANNEKESFIYLGKCEVRMEGSLIGYLEDPDGIGYQYVSIEDFKE